MSLGASLRMGGDDRALPGSNTKRPTTIAYVEIKKEKVALVPDASGILPRPKRGYR